MCILRTLYDTTGEWQNMVGVANATSSWEIGRRTRHLAHGFNTIVQQLSLVGCGLFSMDGCLSSIDSLSFPLSRSDFLSACFGPSKRSAPPDNCWVERALTETTW